MPRAKPSSARSSADRASGAPMPYGRFVRNLLLWAVPVVAVWWLLTPFYNSFLIASSGNLLRLVESPDVTELAAANEGDGYYLILRKDFPPAKRRVYSLRVTDIHFHLLLLAPLFLAVPAISWRERLGNLGWAMLIAVFFHIALVFFWVKFAYATQLGAWSVENYSPFARNFFGLGKHLLDLPFKLAFPFFLWAAFYLPKLLPAERSATTRG